jgi:uncharacterized membrane protein
MNISQIFQRFYFPIFLIYIVCSCVVGVVATLLFPTERTNIFWFGLIATELVLVVPFIVAGMFSLQHAPGQIGSRFGAIAPSLLLLSCFYVLAFWVLLFVNLFVTDLGNGFQIIMVILGAGTLVVALLFYLAMAGAEQGTETFSKSEDTPRVLSALIRNAEGNLADNESAKQLKTALGQIRESISYKLPATGNITRNERFLELAAKIRQITDDLRNESNEERFPFFTQELKRLQNAIPLIQAEL